MTRTKADLEAENRTLLALTEKFRARIEILSQPIDERLEGVEEVLEEFYMAIEIATSQMNKALGALRRKLEKKIKGSD